MTERLEAMHKQEMLASQKSLKPSSPTSQTVISIIIVTYQRPAEVRRLVEHLYAEVNHAPEIEVCVVNNGGASRIDTEVFVDVWIEAGENLGASEGRNVGVRSTHGSLLLFLDDDAMFELSGLAYLREVFQDPELGAIRGKVVPLHHPWFNCMARLYNQGDKVIPDLITLEGVTVIRREIYESVGGYCADQFAGEGLELSERILQQFPNTKIEYHPHLVIAHDYVSSWREFWLKAQRNQRGHERHRVHENPKAAANLASSKVRYRSYYIPDGRSKFQRVVAYFLAKLFRILMRWHGYREP